MARPAACGLGFGFGEHGTGGLGDLDDDPPREGRSRIALGQHPQADQGH